jgi:hypothetical protein
MASERELYDKYTGKNPLFKLQKKLKEKLEKKRDKKIEKELDKGFKKRGDTKIKKPKKINTKPKSVKKDTLKQNRVGELRLKVGGYVMSKDEKRRKSSFEGKGRNATGNLFNIEDRQYLKGR